MLISPLSTQAESANAFLRQWVPSLYAVQPVKNVAISPTGEYVAYLEAIDGLWEIKLYHTSTKQLTSVPIAKESSRIESVAWDGPDLLLIDQIFRVKTTEMSALDNLLSQQRLVVYQLSTNKFWPVKTPKKTRIEIIHNSPTVPFQITGQNRYNQFPDVYTFDWRTGAVLDWVKNKKEVLIWYIDADGICRVGEIYRKRKSAFIYRSGAGKSWGSMRALSGNKMVGFDTTGDVLYYASTDDRDVFGIVPYNLKRKKTGDTIRDEPFDIGDGGLAEYDPRSGGVAGYLYPAEIPRIYYMDTKFREAYNEMNTAYPDKLNRVLGFLADDRTAIICQSSEIDQGSYIFYDSVKHTHTAWITPEYEVGAKDLARIKPFKTTARDGRLVYSYITQPKTPKPPTGYPLMILLKDDFSSRDTADYNPEVQLYAKRGFAVLQINFRGSTGFGDSYGVGSFLGMIEMATTDIVDVTEDVLKKYPLDRRHVVLAGRKLSASLAYRTVNLRPDLFTSLIGQHGYYDFVQFYQVGTRTGESWILELCNDFKGNEDRYAELSPISLPYGFQGNMEAFVPAKSVAVKEGMDLDLTKLRSQHPVRIQVRDNVQSQKMSMTDRISYFEAMLKIMEQDGTTSN